MASLYVGDLPSDVTEDMLLEKFSQAGPLQSVRVFRDSVPKRHMSYAYVDFKERADAERALDTMNYDLFKGRPCRIMWAKHDPSLRRSGVGNIYISNLDYSIDSKTLYDTFKVVGNILSCKVITDDSSSKLGYGFVHFDTQESADLAIEKFNGVLLHGKTVYVCKFTPRKEYNQDHGSNQRYTNVYVKNFGEDFDEDKLVSTFEKFGQILSAVVMKDETGKCRGCGFVNFETHDAAAKAVEELNGSIVNGHTIHCSQAWSKREQESRSQEVNLYVENLEHTVDDERLSREFAKFGNITRAKVVRHPTGLSKGFGFVCFSSPEEASNAITEMNGHIIESKRLYVTLSHSSAERFDLHASIYMQPMVYAVPQSQMQAYPLQSAPLHDPYTPVMPHQFSPSAMWPGQPQHSWMNPPSYEIQQPIAQQQQPGTGSVAAGTVYNSQTVQSPPPSQGIQHAVPGGTIGLWPGQPQYSWMNPPSIEIQQPITQQQQPGTGSVAAGTLYNPQTVQSPPPSEGIQHAVPGGPMGPPNTSTV